MTQIVKTVCPECEHTDAFVQGYVYDKDGNMTGYLVCCLSCEYVYDTPR